MIAGGYQDVSVMLLAFWSRLGMQEPPAILASLRKHQFRIMLYLDNNLGQRKCH